MVGDNLIIVNGGLIQGNAPAPSALPGETEDSDAESKELCDMSDTSKNCMYGCVWKDYPVRVGDKCVKTATLGQGLV